MDAGDRGSIHAVDEKISLETWAGAFRFYETLLRKL